MAGDERRRDGAGPAGHLSRREVAAVLGFRSDFKVRQLEKAGRLRAVRGALGQAWYPRSQVLALEASAPIASMQNPARESAPTRGQARWSDAALIAHLRGGRQAGAGFGRIVTGAAGAGDTAPALTVVDLVADTGISIARAERVYRFWLAHDCHPGAALARAGRVGRVSTATAAATATATPTATPTPTPPRGAASDGAAAGERRSQSRRDRDALIRQLRDPDPAARARAFGELRNLTSGPQRAGKTV